MKYKLFEKQELKKREIIEKPLFLELKEKNKNENIKNIEEIKNQKKEILKIFKMFDISIILEHKETYQKNIFYLIPENPEELKKILKNKKIIKVDEKEKEKGLILNVGVDENNKTIQMQIEKLPHLLVAGATGSGKSVFLNYLILSLYYNYYKNIELILVDPKKNEFNIFEKLPILKYDIIYNQNDVILMLDEIIKIMYQRYIILNKTQYKNIDEFNNNNNNKLKKIIIIIDEIADLIQNNKKEIEQKICRIAQLSRACGIYLILSTQRPDISVLTGLIKANIPSRLCLKVSNNFDSKTILGEKGGEELKGKGSAIIKTIEQDQKIIIQTPFISGEELKKILKEI